MQDETGSKKKRTSTETMLVSTSEADRTTQLRLPVTETASERENHQSHAGGRKHLTVLTSHHKPNETGVDIARGRESDDRDKGSGKHDDRAWENMNKSEE